MKKIFISQPMQGRTEKDIQIERENASVIMHNYFIEKIEILDSTVKNAPPKATPLWYLGKALELMSTADVVVFVKGWEKYRGCRIEHSCALEYEKRIIEL